MSAHPHSEDYQLLQLALQDSLGVVVGEENLEQIEGKLQGLMSRERLARFADLAKALRKDSPASIRSEVLEAITTHSTQWFGFPDINRLLGDYILPSMMEQQKTDFRLWVIGCGQGQSAYSFAMVLDEYRQLLGSEINIEVVASDTSHDLVEIAAEGIYEESAMHGITDTRRQKYMESKQDSWQVVEEVRNMVHFKSVDLLGDICQQGRFDVIISPDVLMYFSTAIRAQLLDEYATLLDPSGILVVNGNEPVLPFCERFELVDHEAGQFYRQIG